MKLTDYKVRILDSMTGTAAKTRVLIASSDGKGEWGTVGVSENIIDASSPGAGGQHGIRADEEMIFAAEKTPFDFYSVFSVPLW